MRYVYAEITNDIDLSSASNPGTWNRYLMYFYGEITGVDIVENGVARQPVISGMSADTYLIYGWFGGKISNLTFDMKGQAATINYICGKLDNEFQKFVMDDLTVQSTDAQGNETPIVLPTDNQANYAPFTYSMYGPFTIQNCVNNADIVGNTYASVFVGYYPLDVQTGEYTIDNCKNTGNVSLRHTGLFFGNNTGFIQYATYFDPNNNHITIKNCSNEGTLRGTSTVNYFCGEPAGVVSNGIVAQYETALTSDLNNNSNNLSVKFKVPGPALEGFGVEITDDNSIKINQPTENNSIDHYVVSVSTYIHAYETSSKDYFGTFRYTIEETVQKNGFPEDGIVTLKNYGLTNDNLGTWAGIFDEYPALTFNNGKTYYYVSDTLLEDAADIVGTGIELSFVGGKDIEYDTAISQKAYLNPSIVAVAAYDANGNLLDSVAVK